MFGGAVRDLLLQRPPHDWDLLVAGPALAAAESLARAVGGRVIARTGKFQQYRIIPKQTPDRQFDLQSLGSEDAAAFLLARDFSCNALAWPLQGRSGILDVTGGLADIARRRLRPLPGALAADPVRALRALRLAAELGFSLNRDDLRAVRKARPGLPRCAAERIKDELFRLLGRWPEARAWCLEALALVLGPDSGRAARLHRLQFGPQEPPGSRRALMALAAALGSGRGKAAGRLRLSRAESEFLKAWRRLCARPVPKTEVSFMERLAAHKPWAVDLARLAAAAGRPFGSLARKCQAAARRLAGLKPLLAGNETASLTGAAGPRLGRLVLRLAALQSLNVIATRGQAKAWAREQKRSMHP